MNYKKSWNNLKEDITKMIVYNDPMSTENRSNFVKDALHLVILSSVCEVLQYIIELMEKYERGEK